MTLPTLQPLELPHRCCSGHQTWWTTSCACSMSCPCSSASVSSRAVGFLPYLYKFILCNLVLLWLWAFFWEFILLYFATGIPFVYRGLPCIYSSAILASASLLSGGDMALLRVIAIAMIVFMISQNFYPHDRVLESQAWKKAVYAGGKLLFIFLCFIFIWNSSRTETQLVNVATNLTLIEQTDMMQPWFISTLDH